MQRLIKQPGEELKRALPFDGDPPIAAIVSVAAEKRNLVAGSAALVVSGELGAGALFVRMSGGTDGESYLVTARAETLDGDQVEAELELAVIDGTWTTPDGGDGYVSIKEFVERFGFDEVLAMTDAGSGRIDRDMLVKALGAAQAVADVNLSARYSVPLATVPEIVKVAIGDMARARLYPRGVPDGIGKAAERAEKLLERIGQGKLPLPAAVPLEAAAPANPIKVSPGVRRYGDGLEGY